ncbi:MAG: hypothetical protein OEW91_05735, partial [Acidimicrobiia bacterium]|nr:hypothetical protein [Acidimicrobiia bacterium]
MKRAAVISCISILSVFAAACGPVTLDLPDEIGADFDLDSFMAEIRDCDKLRDTFVSVVTEAADQVDRLAEASGGRIDPPALREKIEAIAVGDFFSIA